MRIDTGRRLLALVGGAAVILVGCAPADDSDPEESPGIELQIEYCEEDARGDLQEDRCTTDPDRYGDGSYTGYPYTGDDDGRSADNGRSSSGPRGTSR